MSVVSAKQCKTCGVEKHTDEFYKDKRIKDGCFASCKPCWRAAYKESQRQAHLLWNQRNPGKARERHAAWCDNNRSKANAFSRKWARANREKVKARQQRWARENRARVTLYAENRRALVAGASGTTTPEQLQARIDYYGSLCWCCKVPFEAIDHYISLKAGGTNWPANLRPICKSCNSSKGASHPAVFLARRGL